ncbi:unnamed protein product [Amoebophrya sp. A25]|nr:unnamed protein product [Amoebophrya sp. A25]|eukprot:GSA25T00024380001.1
MVRPMWSSSDAAPSSQLPWLMFINRRYEKLILVIEGRRSLGTDGRGLSRVDPRSRHGSWRDILMSTSHEKNKDARECRKFGCSLVFLLPSSINIMRRLDTCRRFGRATWMRGTI